MKPSTRHNMPQALMQTAPFSSISKQEGSRASVRGTQCSHLKSYRSSFYDMGNDKVDMTTVLTNVGKMI